VSEMGVESNVTEDVSFCANEPVAITTSKRRVEYIFCNVVRIHCGSGRKKGLLK